MPAVSTAPQLCYDYACVISQGLTMQRAVWLFLSWENEECRQIFQEGNVYKRQYEGLTVTTESEKLANFQC